MKISKIFVLATAIITILCCLFGLFYNSSSLISAFSGVFGNKEDQPYFYAAFYSMSVICILFYICLIGFSIDLIRGHFRTIIPFTGVLIVEVIYFFSIGTLWLHPKFGMSIAAATGVANGGLMAQFTILLPLWAPIVLWVSKRKLQHQATANQADAPDRNNLRGLS